MRHSGGVLTCGVAALVLACAPLQSRSGGEQAAALVSSLQVYPGADGLRFVLQVTNAGEGPIELNFRSGQTYDFAVRAGSRQVWRWSDEMMFTQALRRERLEAGETWRFEATWRPAPGEGGEYVVVGRLTSSDHPLEEAATIALP